MQIPERVKEERNQDLLTLVNAQAKAKNESWVDRDVEILCEGPSKTNADRLTGRTSQNKIVVFDGPRERLQGRIFDVNITGTYGFTLFGDANGAG